jgi:hypothetical protein
MKALVVYESMFGNTGTIGEAIAASLREHGLEVEAGAISAFGPSALAGFDLVVVGGPTHAHGMSSKSTRKAAVEDKRYPSTGEGTGAPGLREWLNGLPSGTGRIAAAFDTRFDKPRFLTGSAAKGIARRLEQHGYHLVLEPESFFVNGDNQLEAGQTDRATAWGATLAERASTGAAR